MGYFRYLNADEIDCRVASMSEKGLTLLLYKDARVDQNILDEKFGIFGWKREHQLIGNNLYCTVSVKDPDSKEWISKQDVGTESYTEAEKGQASDSFKRACFNLGIGRELYTAPFIFINQGDYTTTQKNGKSTTYDKFRVTNVEVTDGTITALTIYNEKLKRVVFNMESTKKEPAPRNTQQANTGAITKPAKELASEPQKRALRATCDKRGWNIEKLYADFKTTEAVCSKERATIMLTKINDGEYSQDGVQGENQ